MHQPTNQPTNQANQLNHKSNYRPDIDGLRAIACLAVVFFHAFPHSLKGAFQGGFIGVDIFFVISGYLISSILYRHLFNQNNPGSVHIVDFYSRRVRRIFPALISVLITTLALGALVLYPSELKILLKHIIGGSTYVSNFILYNEAGDYFNVDSKFKPLLHLWSLGVEEQFYLVFPIFLWVIYKLNLNLVLSLTVFSIVSFVINFNYVKHGLVSKAFFMPWSRFWELSLGAVLAYVEFEYAKQLYQFKDSKFYKTVLAILFRNPSSSDNHKTIKNIISLTGLLLIVVGLISIKSNGVYPGKKALIPVFGAIFIIAAGKDAFINRKLLSNKVMVFLGLISYPLYLWHWPLLSLLYICDEGHPKSFVIFIVIIISLLLATITFLFIEPKLRYGKHGGLKAIALFVVMVVITSVSVILYQKYNSLKQLRTVEFHHKYYGGVGTPQLFVKGSLAGAPQLLVIGDSFARQYAPYFDKAIAYEGFFTDGNMCYKKINSSTCSFGNINYQKTHFTIEKTIQNSESQKVMIANNFSGFSYRYPIDKQENYLSDLKQQLLYFADKYMNKEFYILEQNYTVPSLMQCFYSMKLGIVPNNIKQFLRERRHKCSDLKHYRIKEDQKEQFTKKVNLQIEQITNERKNLHFIKIRDITCDTNGCKLFDKNSNPLFSDKDHLSIWGRDIVAPVILERMGIRQ